MMIETRRESTEPLVRLVGSSAPFRWLSRAGDHIVVAWRSSAPAALLAGWLANPLDRRVRHTAVVVTVAVVTHLALTGFGAPEPTWWARAAWAGAAATSVAVGACSRAVASAWTHWLLRKQPDGRPA